MTSPGPLLHLWGIPTGHLPPATASTAELTPLLTALLREAVPFIDSAAPREQQQQQQGTNKDNSSNKLWKSRGAPKRSPDSLAPVQVSERALTAAQLRDAVAAASPFTTTTTTTTTPATRTTTDTNTPNQSKTGSSSSTSGRDEKVKPEFWACRRSVHADWPARGTASWAEFVRCFRDEHARSEVAFTPNVVASREAVVWRAGGGSSSSSPSGGGVGVVGGGGDVGGGQGESGEGQVQEQGEQLEIEDGVGGRWRRFTLKVVEMHHKIGRPVLKDRVFPVLQMTAAATEGDEFLVVSVPVPDFGASEASKLVREGQVARYVSVERIRRMKGRDDGESLIEWLMATASDAGGVLPMWVQNMAMPGVIWKDVPLFFKWIADEREGKTS